MRRNLLLTLAAALVASPADAQKRQPHYSELTPEQQAARVNACVDSILAATTQTPEDRRIRSRNATGLWGMSIDRKADDRARKLAFDALIRAYESQPKDRSGSGMVGGVTLLDIALAGQPLPEEMEPWETPEGPGLNYVRHVFRTAEMPPPEAADRADMSFSEQGDLLAMPWCEAGFLLFGDVGGEVNRAYGVRLSKQYELLGGPGWPRPDPPPRKLSDDAAKWWNLCWDARFYDGQ